MNDVEGVTRQAPKLTVRSCLRPPTRAVTSSVEDASVLAP